MRLQLKGKAGGKQNSQSFINKNKLRKVSRADVLLFFRRAIHIVLAAIARLA